MRRRERQEAATGNAIAVRDASDTDPIPMTCAQEGLWFLDQLTGPNDVYLIARAVEVDGALDVAAVTTAVRAVVGRHASLRTGFVPHAGTAVQLVAPAATVLPRIEVPVTDASAAPPSARAEIRAAWLETHARTTFDLTQPPLLRVHLLRFAPDAHVLLVVVHHLVADGWSLDILAREIHAGYAAAVAGGAPAPAELPLQFADFARWEARQHASPAAARDLVFWRTQLAGLEPLPLPTDRPRPQQPTSHGAQHTFAVEPPLLAALKTLARREDATLFMLLLAAFQLLLWRYTGAPDVAVGSPVAGRRRPELEGLIGYFVNTLVLRTDLSGSLTFVQLLGRVRQVCLDAYAHQDLPFDRLVAALRPQRDLTRNPLYQVSFALQNMPAHPLSLGTLRTSPLPVATGTAKFDLALTITEEGAGLTGVIDYSTTLFDAATMTRLARHYTYLLQGLVASPSAAISQLPLLDAAERVQLVDTWNATTQVYPPPLTLYELFEAQVQRSPDAPAIVGDGEVVSYRELNARANRLAHHLRGLGVGPDVLVGLCLHRGPAMVEAVLAILKAGGAYVPLDPQHPRERLAFMLSDTAAPLVVVDTPLRALLPEAQTCLLYNEAHHAAFAHFPDTDLPRLATADQLAYVIYTSGSTGTPKGVEVAHRGVCCHNHWLSHAVHLGTDDRVLLQTSIGFDASAWELFAPLAVGATLIVAKDDGRGDTDYIVRLIREHRVTVALAVPSELSVLLDDPSFAECRSLRYLIAGGEALDRDLARRFVERLPTTALANSYGPTEASIDSTYFDVHQIASGPGTVPIGRPIANTRCHILDGELQPVPIGVAGELYVGGLGLARGYLNRPELTADRFIPDPFRPDVHGARLYRTGDLARYLPDGTIEYLGRVDRQVKLRGFRVELGEIEAVAGGCDGIRSCVVLLREDQPGVKRLVAYVVADAPDLQVPALVERFRRCLPAYMNPSVVVPLDARPITVNGKLDRAALPAPAATSSPDTFTPPRSNLEERVAQVWRALLGIDGIGIYDNFFDLGGHSLLAARMTTRLRRDMGGEIPLRWVFEAPTVAGLAAKIAAREGEASGLEAPIARTFTGGAAPLSSAQEGMWFVDRLFGSSHVYQVAQAHRVLGALNVEALERAVRAAVTRHESLRTGFELRDGTAVQVVWPAHEVVGRVSVEVEEAPVLDAWLRARAQTPFDLAKPPLLRVHVLGLAPDTFVVLLLVHHLVADGWSLDLLTRELGSLYTSASAGGQTAPDPLPRLPIQFADYAIWERQQPDSPATARALAYWRAQLAGLEPLPFPSDRPRPRLPRYEGARLSFALGPAVLTDLKALARREDVTLFMLLLAAFQVMLMRYTGQTDIAVGSPVAGRTRAELEGLVGDFVNTLVLRTELAGKPHFDQLLARVRQVCLDAYAYQDLPFDRLVVELRPERDLARNPFYQVCFAVQHQPTASLALGTLHTEPVPVHTGTAKFDLALTLTEDAAGLTGSFEYSTVLFDAATIARLARHFGQLVVALIARPDQPIARVPLLDTAERTLVLDTWNQTAHTYPPDAVPQLVEAQVWQTPDAPAVRHDGAVVTYAELNARANRLAHHLRAHGVGPDAPVGLCLQRGPALIEAVLAILKAGGAYVPLDPYAPPTRLAFMLADTATQVVLVDPALRPLLPDAQPCVLYSDRDRSACARCPDTDLPALAAPDHLAYIIYTSGSTGTPKGVAVPHRAVVRLVVNTNYVRIGPSDCVAQASNSAFDAATFEIWGALLNGAQLVVVPKDVLLSSEALARHIDDHGITTMFMTTSLFNEHAARAPHSFARLDSLLVGGEALDPVAVQRVIDAAPPKRLLNAYGPTETTTFAVCYEVPQRSDIARTGIPIGRPIASTRCYLLDASLEPVPIGAVGELYIGGAGLACGYINRPELTAEKFVADPFHPGERMYRTGDFVRYRPDGNIEYIGRIDGQVKLRGFRIELGEVEAALGQLPGVAQCAAIVREDQPGDRRLVAYVVASGGTAATARQAGALESPPSSIGLSPRELCRRLAEQVPPHLVPSAIVVVDALPLTANGKLDRTALPSPALDTAGSHDLQPADEVEARLHTIWEDVLGTRPIALNDSFFDVGGHSLLAIKLLDRVEREFERSLSLASLFDAPTIRAQASLVRQPECRPRSSCAVAIQSAGTRPPLFFVSGFGGQLLPYHALAHALGPDQPLYVLDFNSLQDVDGAEPTIERIATEMLRDMRQVQPLGPYQLAGYSLGGKVVYEMAQQLRRAGQQAGLLALLDCTAPGYPRRLPFLTRTVLHVRHALTMGPRDAGAYLLTRVTRLKKYLGLAGDPKVFRAADNVEQTALARAIEARAQPLYNAWRAYDPTWYPGRLTLIRAAIRDYLPGVVDNDVRMGWGGFIGGGIDVVPLNCNHDEMIDARHSHALARLLTPRLADRPPSAPHHVATDGGSTQLAAAV